MNDLGKRLDQLAKAASRGRQLRDPSLTAADSRSVPKRALMVGVAGALAVAAMLFLWQGGDDSTSLVTAQEATEQTGGTQSGCESGDVVDALRSGIPTFDYDPAGSYLDLLDSASAVVSGRISSIERVSFGERDFIELSLTDVVDLTDASRPDIAVIAYDAVWADRSQPDPLASPITVTDVEFVGFVSPWSGVRDGWAPGPEGLYVTCALDAPLVAVAADAASSDDPVDPTVTELRAFLSSEFNQREALRAAEEASKTAEEQARIMAEQQALIDGDMPTPPANLAEARAVWVAAGLGDYRFSINLLGVEGTSTSVLLTVTDGEPRIDEVFKQGLPDPPSWTIEDVFDLAESADVVSDISFDPVLGYPTLVRVDPDRSIGGDDVVVRVTELFALADIDAAPITLEQWLPDPIPVTAELEQIINRGATSSVANLYPLHIHPDVDVFLFQDGDQVCVSAASLAPDLPRRYGGLRSTCTSATDIFLNGVWLSAGGGDDDAAFLVVVPPLEYLNESWTLDVDSVSGFDNELTARSVLVVFDRDARAEIGSATVRCECGDLAYSFIVD